MLISAILSAAFQGESSSSRKKNDSYTAEIAKLFEIIRERGISLKRSKIIDFQIHFPQY